MTTLDDKQDRVRSAAKELEAALNDLVHHNAVEDLRAEIEAVPVQQLQWPSPRPIFTVRVSARIQSVIAP